jgi:hypothetical protein
MSETVIVTAVYTLHCLLLPADAVDHYYTCALLALLILL